MSAVGTMDWSDKSWAGGCQKESLVRYHMFLIIKLFFSVAELTLCNKPTVLL